METHPVEEATEEAPTTSLEGLVHLRSCYPRSSLLLAAHLLESEVLPDDPFEQRDVEVNPTVLLQVSFHFLIPLA